MPALLPDLIGESYVPPGQPTIHYNQKYNVWFPRTPRPPLGYPCIIFNNGGGWASGPPLTYLDENAGRLWRMLKAGWVVVAMGVTGSGCTVIQGSGTTTACINKTDGTWSAATLRLSSTGAFTNYTFEEGDYCVVYESVNEGVTPSGATFGTYPVTSKVSANGITLKSSISSVDLAAGDISFKVSGPKKNQIIPGAGLFKPVSNALFNFTAFSETDGPKCVQAVRARAAQYGINPNAIFGDGRSGGTTGTKVALLGVDFAGVPGFWPTSSRLNGAYLRALAVEWYPACVQTGAHGIVFATHMPETSGGDADTTYEGVAEELSEVSASIQQMASSLRYGFSPTAAWNTTSTAILAPRQQQIRMTNANVRVLMFASGSSASIMGSTDFTNGSETAFDTAYVTNVVLATHDPWNAYTLKEELQELDTQFSSSPGTSQLIVDQATEDYVEGQVGNSDYAADTIIEAGDGNADTDPLEIYVANWFQHFADLQPSHSKTAASSMFHVEHTLG